MMHYEHDKQYVPLKQREMKRRADNYRLAKAAQEGHRVVAFRFYHPAMVGLGRWLVASGTRLQRRYGELTELSQSHNHPMPYERRA